MQASKIRTPKSIEAYTGNLVMKIQVSLALLTRCIGTIQLTFQSKLGGVTHQVPLTDLPGMIRGKTMLLGGNLGFVSYTIDSILETGIELTYPATDQIRSIRRCPYRGMYHRDVQCRLRRVFLPDPTPRRSRRSDGRPIINGP